MRILGDNFVLGRTIEEALARAAPLEAKGYRFSYDMLGERAQDGRATPTRYFDRYMARDRGDRQGRAPAAAR